MNLPRLKTTLSAFAIVLLAAMNGAHADLIVKQYSATNFNSGSGPHGLWTNGAPTPNEFSVQFGTFTTSYDTVNSNNNTAVLDFTAKNSANNYAVVKLSLSGWLDSIAQSRYKKESGAAWSSTLGSVQDYFETIVSGSVTFYNNQADLNGNNPLETVNIGALDATYNTFQFGIGANAKNATELGGSAWIKETSSGITTTAFGNTSHWDLNLGFQLLSTTTVVPEPTSFVLFSTGLLALVPLRRRRK